MAGNTSFGSTQPTSFGAQGGFKSGTGAPQEGGLEGLTKFEGSGGMGIGKGGTKKANAHYSKEYGMKLTPSQAKELRAAEKDFKTRMKDYESGVNASIADANKTLTGAKGELGVAKVDAEGKVKAARGEIDAGWGKLKQSEGENTVEGLFNRWWKGAKKTKVHVVGDGKSQGVYTMPRDAAERILEDKGINAQRMKNGDMAIDVRQQGRIRGQELHDSLRIGTSRDSLLTSFAKEKEVGQAIAKNRVVLQKAAGQLKDAERQVNDAESAYKGEVAKQEGAIQKGEFDVQQMGKTRDREVKGAEALSSRQKEKRKDLYKKWMGARAKAYQALEKMGVTNG